VRGQIREVTSDSCGRSSNGGEHRVLEEHGAELLA
jgi:hypothetical protein